MPTSVVFGAGKASRILCAGFPGGIIAGQGVLRSQVAAMTPIYRLMAGEAELQAAFDLRRQVFVEEQGIPGQLEFDGLDDAAIHMVAVDGGKVVGTARVRFPADSQAKIERMAVAKCARRKGIGRRIVSFLIAECRAREMRQVILHAQHDVAPFYRSCGFEEVGEPFQEAGIMHIKMQMWL